MSSHEDFEKWTDMWSKAQESDEFKHAPKQPAKRDFFGLSMDEEENIQINECDAKYWNQVYRMSRNQADTPDVTNEDVSLVDKEKLDKAVNASNPVAINTVGEDRFGPTKVTPNWTDGKELQELAEIKAKLEKMESKLNAQMAAEKPTASVQEEIDGLKKKIDELSNMLPGKRLHDEAN